MPAYLLECSFYLCAGVNTEPKFKGSDKHKETKRQYTRDLDISQADQNILQAVNSEIFPFLIEYRMFYINDRSRLISHAE